MSRKTLLRGGLALALLSAVPVVACAQTTAADSADVLAQNAALGSRNVTAPKKGNGTLLALLGVEAGGVLLASSGYIAESLDRHPRDGEEFTGGTYLGLGGAGLTFSFIVLLDPDPQPGFRPAWFTALLGMTALGIYDLERAKHGPTSSEIFRDNMIGINAIMLTTAAARWMGRRGHS